MMRTGYYVTARDGNAQRTAWLVGPFATMSEAANMVPAVSHACVKLDDPRFAFAAYGVTKLTIATNNGKPLPPGRLDLVRAVDDQWIGYVIEPYPFVREPS